MTLKHVLKLFSKTEVQEDKTHPNHLSQTILNRLFGRVLKKEGEFNVPSLFKGRLGWVSCAKHTVKHLSSNRPIVLTTSKKAAFTLAEVLITLGIIGVVAALTLPTLIQNHQKQTYVTGLKKAYANLQNAFAKMAYDEDVTDWRQAYCGSDHFSEECFNRLKKQFNVVKGKYRATTEEECWGESHGECHYIYTNDGMLYLFDCGDIHNVLVDVNGDKGPNKIGRDRFRFDVNWGKNKIDPRGLDDYYYCTTDNVNSEALRPYYCTAKVLIEGKMDY